MNKLVGFLSTSTGWGGLELNTIRLAQWLNQNGIRVILFAVPDSRIYKEALNQNLLIVPIEKHRKYFSVIKAFQFARILKSHQVKNLIVFDNKDLDFANLVKLSMWNKLHLIYQQHMQIGISKKDMIHTFRFSGINYWISPLEWLKQEVIKQTKVNSDKIKVIPLGVVIQEYITPKYSKAEARQKLKLANDKFIIGVMGRIDPLKGQLFLVQAIQKLRELNFPVELLIVGDPTLDEPSGRAYQESIKDFIEKEDLSDIVHMHGYTSDTSLFYNAIDVFALASSAETYGMVTIEAMLSGIPIIATNSAGSPEILEYGKLGALYTPGDLDDFCTKLMYLFSHRQESLTLAGKARIIAMDKYSHLKECEEIMQLLAV